MRKELNALLLCCGLLSGCTVGTGNKVVMGEVRYVKEFPQSVTLNRIADFSCDEIGLRGVKHVDGLLIVRHTTAWSILSDDAKTNYGRCIKVGGGPDEFVFTPMSGAAAYRVEEDSLIAYVCDKDRGNLLRFNVSDFIASGEYSLRRVMHTDRMNNSTWDVVAIGRDSVVMQVPNDYFTGFHREITSIDSLWEPAATISASNARVKTPNDLNLLAKITRCSPNGKKCAEAMLYLNQLNVYDTDGSHAMTICVGEELDDVGLIESRWDIARKETYETVSAWEFGFGAIYNGSVWDQLGFKSSNSRLHFFTWDGSPVIEVVLPIRALAFDLNAADGILYAIDAEADELVAFDASAIMSAYQTVARGLE